MATIPDAARLDIAQPEGTQAIVRPDTRLVGAGLQSFGKGVTSLAEAGAEIQIAKRKEKFVTAEMGMNVALGEIGSSYNQETDYQKITDESEERMAQALEEHGAALEHPADLESFKARQEKHVQNTRVSLKKLSWDLERKEKRGQAIDWLDKGRMQAIASGRPGDVEEYAVTAQNYMNGLTDAKIFDKEEAAVFMMKWRDETGKGYIRSLEPEAGLIALDTPAAASLDEGEKQVIRKELEGKLVLERAQTLVHSIDRNLPLGTQVQMAQDGAQDAKVQERAVANIYTRNNAHRAERTAASQAAVSEHVVRLYTEEDAPRVDELSPAELKVLGAPGIAAAENAEARKDSGQKVLTNDTEFLADIKGMLRRGEFESVERILKLQGEDMLKSDTLNSLTEQAEKGGEPAPYDLEQIVNNVIPVVGAKSAVRGQQRDIAFALLEDAIETYRLREDKLPDEELVQKWADQLLLQKQADWNKLGILGFGEQSIWKLKRKEMNAAMSEARIQDIEDADPQMFALVDTFVKDAFNVNREGDKYTDFQRAAIYEKANDLHFFAMKYGKQGRTAMDLTRLSLQEYIKQNPNLSYEQLINEMGLTFEHVMKIQLRDSQEATP